MSTSTGPIFTKFARLGGTVERREVIFSIPQGTLPWQPILWVKSTSNTQLVIQMTFARTAPPAYDRRAIAMQGADK